MSTARLVACASIALAAGPALPRAQGGSPALYNFKVPRGFVVERVAGPLLVERPIVADFDEEGRLYVAESSGSNAKVEQQLAERPHRIVRVEDRDGDGHFDHRVVFADRMMLPQGVMWFDGSLYVGAPPSIWKLTDTDGDGVADQREEWFAGKTLTGCANDLHGPYLGPDGMIYWTKGGFAEQSYERPGRAPLVTRAAHIFRRRPGTSTVESVIAGGMDNPVDVAFTSSGDAIFTATFLEHPQAGRRDALIHAVYGGLYGKPHAVVDSHPRTGELMPPISHFGPAAPSGLTHYASTAFGPGYRGNFFAALFNMQKVTRHALEPSGATFKSRDSDFLVADSLDFHPTDVIEDADGSLLVVDTGGWYKLCCPTSQLAKPDVVGGIYRIRRTAAMPQADPRGRTMSWSTPALSALVDRLDDARPAVQRRAIEHLAGRGVESVSVLARALRDSGSNVVRINALWALTRIDDPGARAAIRAALHDPEPAVRRAALHATGLWRDQAALPVLIAAVRANEPAVRRSAAEALGRIGDADAVPALLEATALSLDRAAEHSLTYALVEIASPARTVKGLSAASERTRRSAVLALEQMPGSSIPFAAVAELLESADSSTVETAWWVAARHPEWAAELSALLRRQVAGTNLDADAREVLRSRLTRLAAFPAMQDLIASLLRSTERRQLQLLALDVIAASRVKQLPPAWATEVAAAIASGDADLAARAIAVARAVPPSAAALDEVLLRVARDKNRSSQLRLDALGALGERLPPVDDDQFALLLAALEPAQPVAIRVAAAAIVEKAKFSQEQLRGLTGVVRAGGPLEVPRLLPAFDQGSSDELGAALLEALEQSKGRSNVRADLLRPRLAKYSPAVQARGEALLSSLRGNATVDAARLDRLVAAMLNGDVRRGQAVFNSAKAACAACHAIGYRGGRLGPDLTSVGQIRSERDLLEAIVFPNASFVRGYEPVVVTTTAGAVHGGVLKAELADEVVLTVGETQEVRIGRAEIADMQPGAVSIMPSGYGDQLSRQELADLLAFLKGTRWGAN